MARHETGAYQWRNLVNGKVYVGGAYRSFRGREIFHRWELNRGRHFNRHLQSAWNLYGEANFCFEVLERCPPDGKSVSACEQRWLDRIHPTKRGIGYNICPVAGNCAGVKRTKKTKRKMSDALKQKYKTDSEYHRSVKLLNKGRVHTERAKKNMIAGHKRRLAKPGERDRIREVANRPEVRAKVAAAVKKQWESEEHRRRVLPKLHEGRIKYYADPTKRAKHKAAVEAWAVRRFGSVEAWKEFTRQRNRAVTAARRREIASNAAKARWRQRKAVEVH